MAGPPGASVLGFEMQEGPFCMNIVDGRHGFPPAGTERWLKDGFLNAEQVLPLSILERQACYYWVMQVHRIDTDYYNRFFGGAGYGPGTRRTWRRGIDKT